MGKTRNMTSEHDFIEAAIAIGNRNELAEKLGITYSAVSVRINKLLKEGKLIKDAEGKLHRIGENLSGVEKVKIDENFRHRTECDQEELGSTETKTINIDVSTPEEGLRLFKKDGVMTRLDNLMALTDDEDTVEIKQLFKQLAIKIFENSLK